MTDIRAIIQAETGAPSLNDADLLSTLGMDSLDLTALFLELSEQTGKTYKPEDFVRTETVGDLVRLFG